MIDKEICDKWFNWNPDNCTFECDKWRDVGSYLDYKNCKCRKRFGGKLGEECSKNIGEMEEHQNKMIYNSTLNDYEKRCS